MSAEDTAFWQRAADLFDRLLELPADQREAALALAGERPLEDAVRRLLDAHTRAAGESAGAREGAPVAVARAIDAWALQGELAAGSPVGPFTVVRALGAGGMGQVYLGERDIDGRRQAVALKLPRHGLSASFLERFRRERGILAQLGHPAIARLIDAGTLADGRPWLAMEFVEGEAILDWCERARADLKCRIRLVLTVLDALQHAHERLVLHRDVKSANVLVDAAGQARLLDFGIGKELGEEGQASTADGQRYFTLASAAPEQVQGAPSSAATDVYAVGVLAYRLLAECAPLDFAGLGAHEALQQALLRVPPLASAAVAALSDERRDAGADARRLKPAAWIAALRGDLDQVLARALRKEAQARYPSAQAFADDLRAVLESRPIAARSSERWYRAQRFVRRHALAVTLVGTLLLSLATFLAYTLLQAAELRAARDQAEQRLHQAEAARDQAEQVTAFLKELFMQTDPRQLRGRELSARELLERGVANLEGAFADAPLVSAELHHTLADIQLSINDFDAALASAQKALRLRAGDPHATQRSHELLARVAAARGDFALALQHLEILLPSEELVPGPAASEDQLRWMAARASARFGAGADPASSVAAYQALAQEYERRHGPQDARTRSVLRRLALAHGADGDAQAELRIEERLTRGAAADAAQDDPALAMLMVRRARVLRRSGQLDEARRLAESGLQTLQRVYGDEHELVVAALSNLAGIEKDAGRTERALALYQDAVRVAASALPPQAPLLAGVRVNLGSYLTRLGRSREAIPHLEAAVAAQAHAPAAGNLRFFRDALGLAYAQVGRPQEARAEWQQVLATYEAEAGTEPMRATLRLQIECLEPPARRSPEMLDRLATRIAQLRRDDGDPVTIAWLERCLPGAPRHASR